MRVSMNSCAHKRRRLSFLASAIAFAALLITVIAGNRSLGFGRSISEVEQKALLILAGSLFISQAGAKFIAKARRSRQDGRRFEPKDYLEGKTDDEI